MGVMEEPTNFVHRSGVQACSWGHKSSLCFLEQTRLSVCEMFSTQVYFLNETSIVLCFQTSTLLLLIEGRGCHGLWSSIDIFLKKYALVLCAKFHKWFCYKKKNWWDIWAIVFLSFLEISTMFSHASSLPLSVPEKRFQALCQFYNITHFPVLPRKMLGALGYGHLSNNGKKEN